jgi:hypothetical protein
VENQDFELEEFVIPEAGGLPFHSFDPFAKSMGRAAINHQYFGDNFSEKGEPFCH